MRRDEQHLHGLCLAKVDSLDRERLDDEVGERGLEALDPVACLGEEGLLGLLRSRCRLVRGVREHDRERR